MPSTRVTRTNPGYAQIARQPPGVTLIDQRPPSMRVGAGTGTLCLVAEFDAGPIESPTEVFGAVDRVNQFGGLGYTLPEGKHRGAVAQRSGGSEPWNGNGFMWLANKPEPPRLILVRVDSSAGTVTFTRLACLTGGNSTVALSNGDTVTFELDGSGTATATYNGGKAQIEGSGATYAALGGKYLELEYDGVDPFVVVFQATDADQAAAIARINAVAAATIAYDAGANELGLQSVIEGRAGHIRIIGGDALAALGHTATPTQDEWTLTVTNVSAGDYRLRVSRFVNGVAVDYDIPLPGVSGGGTDEELRDDLLVALGDLGVPGVTFAASGTDKLTAKADANVILTDFSVLAEPTPGDVTIANTTPGVITEATGTGNVDNLAAIPVDEQAVVIDAVSNLSAEVDAFGFLRVCNALTPGTGTLQATGGTALAALGFDPNEVADAANAEEVIIPAGTRVRDATATGTIWVTMVDTPIRQGAAIKVRPFFDDDTALASTSGNVTEILDKLPAGFVAANSGTITRLTPAQLDARYQAALDKTLADTALTSAINYIAAARTSTAIRKALYLNAEAATESGLAARKTFVRPRLGISRQQAFSEVAENRSDRVQFAFPGVSIVVDEIRIGGSAAGPGFSSDGRVDVGLDSFAAVAAAILPPEEQLSQRLADTDVNEQEFVSLEAAYDPERGGSELKVGDYQALIARGILSPKVDRDNGPEFVRDVTSVDPIADEELVSGSRRRMADFLLDSYKKIAKPFVGKTGSPLNRRTLTEQLNVFLEDLASPTGDGSTARIAGYVVKDVTTDALARQGFQEHTIEVQTFAFMDHLIIRATAGPGVNTATLVNQAT